MILHKFSAKNHDFLVDIFSEVNRRRPDAKLLLIGEGPLRPAIEQKVNMLGLKDRVIFAGVRSDVPRLMRGLMDAFVFPSHYEGLPVVLIEVQAAGLPCLYSDKITEEVVLLKSLMQRFSLKKPASEWAEQLIDAADKRAPWKDISNRLEKSSFNISSGIRQLEDVYTFGATAGI